MPLRILVIRRDHIGDMICTTPLLHALREHYPHALLSVLSSSYNKTVLDRNPDIDEVFVFPKRNDQSHGYGFLSMLWHRWRLVYTIRKRRFDIIILANGGWRYARRLRGKKVIGFREVKLPETDQPDVIVPLENNGLNEHEIVKLSYLGMELGIMDATGPIHLFPDPKIVHQEKERLLSLGWRPKKPTVALHISTRRSTQLWQEESFIALARTLMKKGIQIFLFWSPGKADNPMHPGDDEKAERMIQSLQGELFFPCPTKNLQELIAMIDLVDQAICSDGGAMHVAAALKKPILCFFGTSFVHQWYPWGVPYVALQKPSRRASSITVEEAFEGFVQLQEKASKPLF